MPLSDAQRLKFRLLAEGMAIAPAARKRLDDLRGQRQLTPADFASTTGLILQLEDDVWVNAPVADHNQNFVVSPRTTLHATHGGFVVASGRLTSQASICLPPLYHGHLLTGGHPANHFVFTHADRVRLSPIRGCAMRCLFCNVPYEDQYGLKPVDLMIDALRTAFADPLQPARHVLISGGTPIPRDVPFLARVYERVLAAFPDRDIDVMMVPVDGLFDLARLKGLGLNELSINIELFNPLVSRSLMPQKNRHGINRYLDFLGEAVNVLGRGRVRSILMVGLESASDTLAAVKAVLRVGATPVLSPFRPDTSTPLHNEAPPSASQCEEIFLAANDAAGEAGARLGPSCPPCTHNTLALAESGASNKHPTPVLV